MATKHPSHGTLVGVDFAGGTSYTDIGNIDTDITPAGLSRGVITTTAHGDTWATKMAGIPDAGQLSFGFIFDPATAVHEDFVTEIDATACTVPTWQITMNMCTSVVTSAIWTYAAFIVTCNITSPLEGVHRADVVMEITGLPTLTIVTP